MTAATPANLEQRLRERVRVGTEVYGWGPDDLYVESLTQAADALAEKDTIIEKARVALEKHGWHYGVGNHDTTKYCNGCSNHWILTHTNHTPTCPVGAALEAIGK